MKKDISKYEIGVVIGRFQVPELHDGHRWFIDQVVKNHKKVIVFLGTTKAVGLKNNPLDFDTRKKMIQKDYPNVIISPLPDMPNNQDWTNELDKRVREIFTVGKVLLYGSRNSFIPSYSGSFDTIELEEHGVVSGTKVREKIAEDSLSTTDFRSGVIYNAHNQFEKVFPTVDIATLNEDGTKVLLCKKTSGEKYRFIGGFAHPTDESYENTVRRVYSNKTKTEIDGLRYIGSCIVKDYRYRGESDNIMTILFLGKFIFGKLTPSENISELKWFNIIDINTEWISNNIVDEHKPVMDMFIKYKNKKLNL